MSKILVVEDNPANMLFVTAVLENTGHQVLQAEDATTGIRLPRGARYDLVFMGIQLPGMDQFEATRLLKAALGPLGAALERQINDFLYPEVLQTLKRARTEHPELAAP